MRFDLQARHQQIDKLVENKLSFDSDDAKLSIYDTYESVFNVPLSSGNVVFCGMLQGKKVMHVETCDYHHDFCLMKASCLHQTKLFISIFLMHLKPHQQLV